MKIEVWFDFGSTYSYPTVMRIEALAVEYSVDIHWKPFLLGVIFKQQGLNDSPFNVIPAKGQYMWRDLERVCEEINIPFQRPSVFPRNGLLAARIVSMFEYHDWVGEFIKRVFLENFAHNQDISSAETISKCLLSLQLDAKEIINVASSQPSKEKLFRQTQEAQQKEIFGAPMFIVGKDMFWGNDRLEAAIKYALLLREEVPGA